EARLRFSGAACVQGGEDDFGSSVRGSGGIHHVANPRWNGRFQPPTCRIGVWATFGTVRGRQPAHFKPRMVLQHLDEALADHARGTENSYRNFAWHKD